jgi:hypothetical protein
VEGVATFHLAHKIKKEEKMKTASPGILTILFVIFVVLKLTDLIDWSWWWVTAPVWIPLLILHEALAFLGLIFALNKNKWVGKL